MICSPPVNREEVPLEAKRENTLSYGATAEDDEDQSARTLGQELPEGGAGHPPGPAADLLFLHIVHG